MHSVRLLLISGGSDVAHQKFDRPGWNLAGNPIPYASKWTLAGNFNYSFAMSGGSDAFIGGQVMHRTMPPRDIGRTDL